MHPLTLRFPDALETEFRARHYGNSLTQIRLATSLRLHGGSLCEALASGLGHASWYHEQCGAAPFGFQQPLDISLRSQPYGQRAC